MKTLTIALAALLLASMAAACDDHHGECEIEDWRAINMMSSLMIEGVATCDSGMVSIRVYDGNSYVGNATGFIKGHAFTALTPNVEASGPFTLKYSIDTSW